jgi:hypothetical protein
MQEIHRLVVGWWGDQHSSWWEDRLAEERESTLSPQAEVAVESKLEEATLVEGMCSSQLVVIVHSSRSFWNSPLVLIMTGAQGEGGAIPEAVVMEAVALKPSPQHRLPRQPKEQPPS